MPLPFILGAAAAAAGVAGLGSGIKGAKKVKDAQGRVNSYKEDYEKKLKKTEELRENSLEKMDELGKTELLILDSFSQFSNLIEKIQNKPDFKEIKNENVSIPEFKMEEIKEASVGAEVLLAGIGGAATGALGGFAAAGATTATVMALGTASTGTAIAGLSGAAATNATLAAIGGGAIKAGGGGIALGTTILGASTLGVGLLIGGVIFSVAGDKISGKSDDACSEIKKANEKLEEVTEYVEDIRKYATKYNNILLKAQSKYDEYINTLSVIINVYGKTDWDTYLESEKLVVENLVLLVGLLYNMCKVKVLLKAKDENGFEKINKTDINHNITKANNIIASV